LRLQADGRERTWGNGGRLEDLYVRHAGSAGRLAYVLTGNRTAAEDLVQEAFIRVASRGRREVEGDAFAAYLRRTIVNLHISWMRRRKLERAYLRRETGRPATDVPPDVEAQQDMRRRLLALPPRQRAALVLRYYEDLSEAETADVLGCSRAAAKSLVSRGIEALRTDMRGEDR